MRLETKKSSIKLKIGRIWPSRNFFPALKMLNKKPDIFCLATSSLHSKKYFLWYCTSECDPTIYCIPHLASLAQHYSPPFRTSEGAAFSTQVRVGIFRTKVDLNKLKWRNRIRSFEGAEYSTQVSAPAYFPSLVRTQSNLKRNC